MAFVDPVGDMITRLRNGQMRNLHNVKVPFSVFRKNILEVLKKEGFISSYKVLKTDNKDKFEVNLKYTDGQPVIKEIRRISKPGRRIYAKAENIPKIQNGLGISIVSTPKGVMSDIEARKNNVGGELICSVC